MSDWTPVRTGDVYCSPACGGKCTWADFDRATKAADAMVDRLGPAFKPRVWENLGWHCEVVATFGSMALHVHNRHGKYTAFVGSADSRGGFYGVDRAHSDTDPMEAAHQAMLNLKTHVAKLLGIVDDAKSLATVALPWMSFLPKQEDDH